MNRLFSVRRRRAHIVDISAPLVPGVTGYRLQWASNFSGPWATFLTSTSVGFFDTGVNRAVVEARPGSGQARIVFDPTNFLIPDDNSFWVQMVHMTGNVAGLVGSPTLILPDSLRHGQGFAVIQGTAPNTPVLQLELPVLAPDLRLTNESAVVSLLVGSELNGRKVAIRPNTTQNFSFQGTLFLAGNGSAADFSATFAPTVVIK